MKFVVEKCVHPVTNRRFTPETIKQAIKDIYFPIKMDQDGKKQALDCIKALKKKYRIVRGLMRVRVGINKDAMEKFQQSL